MADLFDETRKAPARASPLEREDKLFILSKRKSCPINNQKRAAATNNVPVSLWPISSTCMDVWLFDFHSVVFLNFLVAKLCNKHELANMIRPKLDSPTNGNVIDRRFKLGVQN